jgi:menaquinone reductase, multiheme cytochrome c subunit
MQIFPKSFDTSVKIGAAVVVVMALGAVGLFAYFAYPTVRNPGYAPRQPVNYSHRVHVGQMGMDCTYCHYTVQKAAFAAIPSTEICMNCHIRVRVNSQELAPVRESYATGDPIEWIKVHRLPDYVFFNHSAHVNSGVSCVSCHGRVDQMEIVRQVEPLNMAWCLDCHRNPAPHIRPVELVTRLDWVPDRDPAEIGRQLITEKNIVPPTNCAGCHR